MLVMVSDCMFIEWNLILSVMCLDGSGKFGLILAKAVRRIFTMWPRFIMAVLTFATLTFTTEAQLSVSDLGAGMPSSFASPKSYYWTNPAFHYWFPTTNAFVGNIYLGTNEIGGGMLDSTNTFAPLQFSFMVSNSASFEVKTLNQDYGAIQVRVTDGQTNYFSTVSWGQLYPNSSPSFYLVKMPYLTNWNVTVAMTLGGGVPANVWGLNVPSTAAVYSNTLPRQRIVVVLGDSYAKGYIASSGSQFLQGFAWDLWSMAPNILIYPAGIGGQGYVNAFNYPPYYQSRLTNDVFNLNPDYVLVTGTINDNGYTTNSIYAAAVQLYQTISSQLPNAKFGVIGTWYLGQGDTAPVASEISRDQAQQAAANLVGLPYASPVQGLWGAGGVGSDSVHPTAARYQTFAHDINTNMIYWWGTNWTQGPQASVSVIGSTSPLRITTAALAACTNGLTYSQSLQAAGGHPPYTWSVMSGSLPASISLSSTGLISGLATPAGNYNITLGLTDSTGVSTNQSLALAIVNVVSPLQLVPTALANGTNGLPYSQSLSAIGGTLPYAWSITSGSLPAGLTLSPSGVISGTAAATGTFNFTVGLLDALGVNVSLQTALTIVDANITATTLNVADFGAIGDATSFTVSTISNSTVVSVVGTNIFSSADVGKVIEVFRAGPWLSYSNWGVVVTQQDIICTITNVSQGTNLSLSIPCGWTMNAYCVVGRNNAQAFQAAINTASNLVATGQSTNATIGIPPGQYLMISSSALNPNYVMSGISDTHPALTIASGGITLLGLGNSPTDTILMGCGAGMEHRVSSSLTWISSGYAPYVPMRDTLIWCRGPVSSRQYPLVLQNMTLDGGLTNAVQNYNYWTPIQANGAGWDTTHHAVADWDGTVSFQMHQLKVFTNCVFQHWRGEMLICWTSNVTNCFNDIANCTFSDGNATADNLYYGQHIHGCTFKNLEKVTEYYQANANLPTLFENNLITNIAGNILVINGATTNANPPAYIIQNNIFYGLPNLDDILFTPAENVVVSNNVFHGQATGISFSAAGLQPANGTAAVMSNIVIVANSFNDTFLPICMDGYPVMNVAISNNTSASTYSFAMGGSGFKTNIILAANVGGAAASSGSIQGGEYFVDLPSDQLGWYQYNDWTGTRNIIAYWNGHRHMILHSMANSVFSLDDTKPAVMPVGAQLSVTNIASSAVSIYSGSALTGPANALAPHQCLTFYWQNGAWQTNAISLLPPSDLRLQP